MMNIKKILYGALGTLALVLTGCGSRNEWTVKGELPAVADSKISVEAWDNGRWYVLDSVNVAGDGKFSFSHAPQGYPDVFRLKGDGVTVYFPIDSIETVNVSSRDNRYYLSGSQQAVMMMRADSILNSDLPRSEMINSVARLILEDPASVTAYYVINRKVGGSPLFNPADRSDLRIIGAVANAFNANRPNDPRTSYLKKLFISNMRHPENPGMSIEANEIGAPEINLYDNTGVRRALSQYTGNGDVVLLNFTTYLADESPAFNVMLNSIYEKYRSRGFEIYQVSLDDNEYEWKRTADNLPWVTVINDAHDNSRILLDYNVGSIPAIFIINRNGEVVERVTDLDQLDSLVAKYL